METTFNSEGHWHYCTFQALGKKLKGVCLREEEREGKKVRESDMDLCVCMCGLSYYF